MKYSREEYNERILLELRYTQAKGEITEDLKFLFFELANDISKSKERYEFIDEDSRTMCVVFAYDACMRFAPTFNIEKSDRAFSYFSIVIRSSFGTSLIKQRKRNKLLSL
jgi:hypothetical protein